MSARRVSSTPSMALDAYDEVVVFKLEGVAPQMAREIVEGLYPNCLPPADFYHLEIESGIYAFQQAGMNCRPERDSIIRVIGDQIWATDFVPELANQLIGEGIQYRHGKTNVQRRKLISASPLSRLYV